MACGSGQNLGSSIARRHVALNVILHLRNHEGEGNRNRPFPGLTPVINKEIGSLPVNRFANIDIQYSARLVAKLRTGHRIETRAWRLSRQLALMMPMHSGGADDLESWGLETRITESDGSGYTGISPWFIRMMKCL
jgi:hypothetical protein